MTATTKKKDYKCSKETEIELLKKDITFLRELVQDIHKSIVGRDDGRRGLKEEVQMLKINQENNMALLKLHCKIIDGLNLKLAYYSGAIAVITFVISLAVKTYW